MHEKVKAYLAKLPSPQKEICEKVRKIIVDTFPNLEESLLYGVPSYEDKFYILGLNDHVKIGFSIEGLSYEEMKLFQGKGKSMRYFKVYSLDDINEKEIIQLLKVVK